MAYTDLINSQVTLVPNGGSYAFAFDLPQAQDGSPHVTHMGLQMNIEAGGALAPSSSFSNIISSLRIKVGSTVVIDWNDNAAKVDGTLSQLGVLLQRIGGDDFFTPNFANAATGGLAQITIPLGIPANVGHRVNVSVTLGNEQTLMAGQALIAASSTLDVPVSYGVSLERTVIGSRQDFTMSQNSTRTIVAYGKEGFNMLGVMVTSNTSTADLFNQFRVNNGAFRELTTSQWRSLNNSYGGPDPTQLRLGAFPTPAATGVMGLSTPLAGQAGAVFLNLRRLTAGANADLAVTYGATPAGATDTLAMYPIWVSNIGKNSGPPVRQTIVSPQSTTLTVEQNSQG